MYDLEIIVKDISDIINQDGDDYNDGEIIDQIVYYLKVRNLYTERI